MYEFILSYCLVTNTPITPTNLYNGVHQSIMVEIDLPSDIDIGHVVLLDNENKPISSTEAVTEGQHDLLRRLPQIQQLQRAAWVQLLVEGEPIGTPIVIDPLRSRLVPVVEEVTKEGTDITYTKIVDWKDEAIDDEFEESILSGWRVYLDKDAVIETSEGQIHVTLRPDAAPNTAWNFRELAEGGLYYGTVFHRVVPLTNKGLPFVIQGGDPTGTGSGGPGWWLPIEKSSLPHDFGVISMARAGDPDSAGCQFFLCLSREGTARLDGQYCAFGETTLGGEVIKTIAATPIADPKTGRPKNPPRIHNITMELSQPRYLVR
ncbi:MAG: peptidylprolyl isomerase [Phycisphaerales bacterium]|jgi:peptidyl-prolyl cis-trans isomerase B (cyclophilin B)|nr:peptidylprolyl isomerase [Phycisphaerales bacterium]